MLAMLAATSLLAASALRTHAGLALRTVRLGAVPDASGDDGTDAALDKLFGTSAVGDESAAVSDESSSSGWDEGFASAEWAGATTKSATTMAQATRSLRAEGDSPSGFSSADAAVAWSPSGTTAESWSAPRWDDSSDESESDTADVPSAAEGMMEVAMTNAFWNVEEQVEWGEKDSHELVAMDEEGEPDYERFTYVDEHSCIGCTMCAGVAPSTFFMEDAHGRARVFRQQGDADETIAEAIATCPVNCIHYVPFAELAKLETRRRGQVINNAGRLVSQAEGKGVGTSHLVSGPLGRYAAMARISGNAKIRCGNCPSNGCADCPMYGAGENPVFVDRAKAKEVKRRDRIRREIQAETGTASGSVEL